MVSGIRFYQATISPLTPPACRFVPSCSAYAVESLERHGTLGGCWLTLRRICRCHPFGGQGFDPVPGCASRERSGSEGVLKTRDGSVGNSTISGRGR